MSKKSTVRAQFSHPIQLVSEILDFQYPDEDKLREHLETVGYQLKKASFG